MFVVDFGDQGGYVRGGGGDVVYADVVAIVGEAEGDGFASVFL